MIKNILAICLLFSLFLSCKNNVDVEPEDPIVEDPEIILQSSNEFNLDHATGDSLFIINRVIQLSDSSYVLAGGVEIDGGDNQNVLIKLDKFGNREWITIMDNTDSPLGIETIVEDGNQYLGYRARRFSESRPPMIIRFDQNGNFLNEVPFDDGIVGYDYLKEDDGFVIAGGINNIQFQKIRIDGTIAWTHTGTQPSSSLSISKLMDGNYITLGGGIYSGTAEHLVKLKPSGEVIWTKSYKGYTVLALPDGGFITIIEQDPNFEIIRFDENGEEVWTHLIGDPSAFNIFRGTLNLIHDNLDHFVYSIFKSEGKLELNVLNSTGALVNTITIDNVKVGHHFAMIKTLDNGIFIVRSKGTHDYHLDFIKLSPSSIF